MSGVRVPAVVAQGWCPSTYRLFEAPDGLLARVKVPGGILSTTQWGAIGAAAATCGNGIVEITRRANVQLRGIGETAGDELRARLAAAGLVAPTEGAEDRRNVLASPTAGLDPTELLDVRPVVRSVVETLDHLDDVLGPNAAALPHKFGVLVDGGGQNTLRGRPLDVAVGAVRLVDGGQIVFELCLGAALPLGTRDEAPLARRPAAPVEVDPPVGGTPVLTVAPDDVAALVTAAAGVSASPPGGLAPGRIADLVATVGLDALVAAVNDRSGGRIARRAPGSLVEDTSGLDDAPPLGRQPGASPGRGFVGLVHHRPTLRAEAVRDLASVLDAFGLGEVRLTPWRTVVVPGVSDQAADRVIAAAADHGWSTDLAERPPASPTGPPRAKVGAGR